MRIDIQLREQSTWACGSGIFCRVFETTHRHGQPLVVKGIVVIIFVHVIESWRSHRNCARPCLCRRLMSSED